MGLITLQAVEQINSTVNYLPIGIQLIFAIVFVGGMMALTHLLGPKRKTADKVQGKNFFIKSWFEVIPTTLSCNFCKTAKKEQCKNC